MARGTWLTFGVAAQDRAYFEFKVNKLAEGSFQVLRALSDPPRLETVGSANRVTASLFLCGTVHPCSFGARVLQVGVASRRCNLDGELGDDSTLSWGFQSHAGGPLCCSAACVVADSVDAIVLGGVAIKDGDVIGVSYDQADVPCANFFHNGQLLENERSRALTLLGQEIMFRFRA